MRDWSWAAKCEILKEDDEKIEEGFIPTDAPVATTMKIH